MAGKVLKRQKLDNGECSTSEDLKKKAAYEACKESLIDAETFQTFKDYPINELTLRGLTEANYIKPTEVQKLSLGLSLRGKDVVACARTGSGKTLAFLIPVLEVLYKNKWCQQHGVGALIITPTRELALQIFEVLNIIGKYHSFSCGGITGGKDWKFEQNKIWNCSIIIATPGRLAHHLEVNHSAANIDNLQIMVLDEADACLSQDFKRTMKSIFSFFPKDRQTLLFSATQTDKLEDIIYAGCRDPVTVNPFTVDNSNLCIPPTLKPSYVVMEVEKKINFLYKFIKTHSNDKVLIFTSTTKQVMFYHTLFTRLLKKSRIIAIHGKKHQNSRSEAVEAFFEKSYGVLFSTDLSARGLDFPGVEWVIQIDCPENIKTYIHRAGRTARNGEEGKAILVLTPSQEASMIDQMQLQNIPIRKFTEYVKDMPDMTNNISKIMSFNSQLRLQAERAYLCHVQSLLFMSDKLCDLNHIDLNAFARSYGLAKAPLLNKKVKRLYDDKLSKLDDMESNETNFKMDNNKQSKQDCFEDLNITIDDVLT